MIFHCSFHPRDKSHLTQKVERFGGKEVYFEHEIMTRMSDDDRRRALIFSDFAVWYKIKSECSRSQSGPVRFHEQ